MNEKDVVNLYQSLARCRDGFMQTRTRRDERQPVQRMSERDRELRNASATADRPHRWGGEVFRTNTRAPGTTRPLKFLRTVIFLKIKRDGNEKFLWQDHQNRQLTLMS